MLEEIINQGMPLNELEKWGIDIPKNYNPAGYRHGGYVKGYQDGGYVTDEYVEMQPQESTYNPYSVATPVTSEGQYLEQPDWMSTDIFESAQDFYNENLVGGVGIPSEDPIYTGAVNPGFNEYGGGYVPLEGFLR